MKSILRKVDQGVQLTKEDAVALLKTHNQSPEFYELIAKANELSRKNYQNRGYIFVQIGINSDPCSGNCKFCSIAKDNFCVEEQASKSQGEILEQVNKIDFARITALFLMTTADYSQEDFLKIGKAVRAILPPHVIMVANVGDFDDAYALKLKDAGFGAAYHIVRLREGSDTALPREQRIRTLDAIKKAGLDLYYCVEPIGREHSYDEMADEMIRAREYGVDVMAVMARTPVRGTAFEHEKPITELEQTKIAAVARLVTNPGKSMNIHEPKKMALLAGVNQLYAEIGVNPRDTKGETEKGRGFGVDEVIALLEEAEYHVD
ncbi:biotin synthase BioB [Christensenella tenuis]|jgi:biotin synthase|uniref:Radical SAM protein n=1 Tax=Christensenella tenuis TaxID=2763033 RepID=A0ABR7EB31_9FIRM|nr:radical SAM protein [Christensenella tenuis]MBC5646995.1 radical SAM protein [Christensenella tenuis]